MTRKRNRLKSEDLLCQKRTGIDIKFLNFMTTYGKATKATNYVSTTHQQNTEDRTRYTLF